MTQRRQWGISNNAGLVDELTYGGGGGGKYGVQGGVEEDFDGGEGDGDRMSGIIEEQIPSKTRSGASGRSRPRTVYPPPSTPAMVDIDTASLNRIEANTQATPGGRGTFSRGFRYVKEVLGSPFVRIGEQMSGVFGSGGDSGERGGGGGNGEMRGDRRVGGSDDPFITNTPEQQRHQQHQYQYQFQPHQQRKQIPNPNTNQDLQVDFVAVGSLFQRDLGYRHRQNLDQNLDQYQYQNQNRDSSESNDDGGARQTDFDGRHSNDLSVEADLGFYSGIVGGMGGKLDGNRSDNRAGGDKGENRSTTGMARLNIRHSPETHRNHHSHHQGQSHG